MITKLTLSSLKCVHDDDGDCDGVDVNECREGRCQQQCNNTPGSYQCYCRSGYRLAADNHSCSGLTFFTVRGRLSKIPCVACTGDITDS